MTMTAYHRSLMTALLTCFLHIILLQTNGFAEAQDIKGILDSYDAKYLSQFNVSLVVGCKSNITADQDPSTFTLQLTGNNGTYALIQNRAALGKSRYVSKANPLDYNSDGDYKVANMKMRAILFNGTSWRVRSEYDDSLLKKTGEALLLADELAPRLEIYPVNQQDAANLFFRYLLCLGRGYSQLLDSVTSTTVNSDGIVTVTGPGSLFSADKGAWRMEIDTKHDYLVKSASFTLPKQANPLFKCQSRTYWAADIPLFAEGVLEFPIRDFKITAKLAKMASASDAILYNATADSVTNYPSNTSIMDFSRIDADGMPLVVMPLSKDMLK